MPDVLIVIPAVLAAINWWAAEKDIKKLDYLTKPATMLALIAWMVIAVGIQGPMILFTLGFFASMLGDVFLMLPRERFISGLVAFLIAHVCYIIGFNFQPPPVNFVTILFVLGVALIAWRVIQPLRAGLLSKGRKELLVPVQVYAGVIALMLLSAMVTLARPEWGTLTAALASLGAMSFFLSDTLLAWNRFVSPFSHAALIVRVTYHLGQILIALGVAIQFT